MDILEKDAISETLKINNVCI